MATLDDGTEVVVKAGEPSAIAAEAAGLRWLAEPGASRVPEVLGTDGGRMVSTRVPAGRAARRRRRALRPRAGRPARRGRPGVRRRRRPAGRWTPGSAGARMVNETGDDWPSWYAEHRVLPYARQAREQGDVLGGADVAVVERACARLRRGRRPARGPRPPARRPVDAATCSGRPTSAWVIDPAAHGGHRETDLAMLALFGRPHSRRSSPPTTRRRRSPTGWRDRVGLHQLFPLLVHTVLFGGGYGARALAVCERCSRS